jgi:hypothetical protein
MKILKDIHIWGPAFFLFIAIPWLGAYFLFGATGPNSILSLYDQALILSVFTLLSCLMARHPWAVRFVSAAEGFYYCIVYSLIILAAMAGHPLDLYYFVDSWGYNILGAVLLFGEVNLALMVGFLFVLWSVCYLLAGKILERAGRAIPRRWLPPLLVLLSAALVCVPSEASILPYHVAHALWTKESRLYFDDGVVIHDNRGYSTESDENIFMVMLESGNSIASLGMDPRYGGRYNATYIPNIYNLTKNEGVFFPYFWGNGMQTLRGEESALCGIVGNFGEPFAQSERVLWDNCLPGILSRSGYLTVALIDDNYNEMDYMRKLGFDEVIGEEIMKPTDVKYPWGYDDCAFYRRAFKYLHSKQLQGEKMFVFLRPLGHHLPFHTHPEYAFLEQFPQHENYLEEYLDSALYQDYCFNGFLGEFRKFDRGNTHLFILPDHSVPLGLHDNNVVPDVLSYNDNFLTFLSYIPPRDRAEEFNVGATYNSTHSQTDLLPTIFDLLNRDRSKNMVSALFEQRYPNSFAPQLLKGGILKDYEDCHVLVQPYGDTEIAVVKGWDKYVYYMANTTVAYYDLSTDFWEDDRRILEDGMGYEEFIRSEYYCPRYRPAGRPAD